MESIYEYFKSICREDGYISDSYAMLPELIGNNESTGWIPGAFEGILLRSNVDLRQPSFVNFLLSLKLRKAVKTGKEKDADKFYESFMKYSAITTVDPLLSNISGKADTGKALSFARKTLTTSPRAEIVKFALALLGEYGDISDLFDIVMISSHEEFTLYGTVALKNILVRNGRNVNDVLIPLCGVLSGWGKIAAIPELDFSDSSVSEYVLSFGCANKIADSYLSNICAIKGKLASNLKKYADDDPANIPSDELFNGIVHIFSGLTDDSHPENDGLTDYPDYAEAFDYFCTVAKKNGRINDPAVAQIISKIRP